MKFNWDKGLNGGGVMNFVREMVILIWWEKTDPKGTYKLILVKNDNPNWMGLGRL